MPLLQRVNPYQNETALLESVGIITKKDKIEDTFLGAMEGAGITPEAVLGTISQIMQSGDSDGIKLAAAREALKLYMHPAFVQQRAAEASAQNNQIIFNISGENVQLNNVLRPKVSQ